MKECITVVKDSAPLVELDDGGFHIGLSDRYEHRLESVCLQQVFAAIFQTCSDGDNSVLPSSSTDEKLLSDNNA